MRFASAREADFSQANLSGSYAPFLSAKNANFGQANLSGAVLLAGDLAGTRFDGADLSGAVLAFADLRGASFRGAKLQNAHLVGADLNDADFTDAQFDNTNMLAARLNPFALSRDQRAGTCQVLADYRTRLRLVERWESSRFSSGFEYDDINYDTYFPVPGLGLSLLEPCESPPSSIQGFYPGTPGEVSIKLDRHLISTADRKQHVLQRLKTFFDRFKAYQSSPIVFGPVEP
jgi:hypothetical protein